MKPAEYDKILELEENNWWYLSRRALVKDYLNSHFGCDANRNILDIASAAGTNFFKFSDYGKLIGVDLAEESIRICRSRGLTRLIQADGGDLPFKKESFDLVFAFDAIEHIQDDRAALNGFLRVLKPDGRVIITVPAHQVLWSQHDTAFHHFRRYSKAELTKKLQDCGFEIERMTYWSATLFFPVLVARKLNTLTQRLLHKTPQSDFFLKLPSIFEKVLGWIQSLERVLISRGISFPVGVSLFCVARKASLEIQKAS